MTEYYNEDTKKSVSLSGLKAEFPNTSFPATITNNTLESFGYAIVQDIPTPVSSDVLKHYVRDGIEKDDNGVFSPKYVEKDKHADYVDGDGKTVTKATQDAALKTSIDAETARLNRVKRNRTLFETDWSGLSDVTMSDSMKTYRQALRDLPTHSNWPNLTPSDWPTKS